MRCVCVCVLSRVDAAVATPLGGAILDALEEFGEARDIHNLGYIVLFVIATIYFILGTVFVYRIKLAPPGQEQREKAMELTSDFERLRDEAFEDSAETEAKSDRRVAMTVY